MPPQTLQPPNAFGYYPPPTGGGLPALPALPTLPTPNNAPSGGSAPVPGVPNGLDPKAYILTKAIGYQENGGKKPDYSIKGQSGEFGAYQYMPATWDARAAKYLGPNYPKLEDATPDQQNEVQYKWVEDKLSQGYTPAQVASMHNAGEGAPDAYLGNKGTNSSGVNYDTKAYADGVQKYAEQLYAGIDPDAGNVAGAQAPAPSPVQLADNASAERTGAFFPAVTGDSPLSAGLKTAGNLIPSAFNFAKGAVQSLNPLAVVQNLMAIPGAFQQAVEANGGDVGKTIALALGAAPGEAYKAVVPQAARELIAGDVEGAQRDVTNDPVGTVAPFVFAAQGAAKLSDVSGLTENASGALDNAISKTGQVVTKPVGYAFGGAGNLAKSAAQYATAKVTGLNPDTISQIAENPEAFTPEKLATASRASLGQEVGDKLTERIDALGETGANYEPIKGSTAPVKVDPDFLGSALEKATGLTRDADGTFQAGAKSAVDSASDVAKVQRLYDAWQPYFEKGEMTADDFLTLRTKLSKLANFDTSFGKSAPLESAAADVRSSLNNEYRDQIPSLAETDADYSSQSTELKTLRKGLIDKDGNLTDTAINRIANAAGKGKDAMLARLEEISPGITLKIRQLKAVEDIQNIHKVGTYTKAGLQTLEGGGLAGGVLTGNVPVIVASIMGLVLSQPEVAVRMIRAYGQYAAPIAGKVLEALKKGGSAVNNLPETASAPIKAATVFGRPQPTAAAQ